MGRDALCIGSRDRRNQILPSLGHLEGPGRGVLFHPPRDDAQPNDPLIVSAQNLRLRPLRGHHTLSEHAVSSHLPRPRCGCDLWMVQQVLEGAYPHADVSASLSVRLL